MWSDENLSCIFLKYLVECVGCVPSFECFKFFFLVSQVFLMSQGGVGGVLFMSNFKVKWCVFLCDFFGRV